jgi:flagellar biosynthesis/type III secretory pathway chaperone
MAQPLPIDPAEWVQAASAQVQVLLGVLEQEFQVLKTPAVDALEALQAPKNQALSELALLAARVEEHGQPPPGWADVLAQIHECRDRHQRNEQLLRRQIEVIRTTLRSLQSVDPQVSVELYDQLGQTSRLMGSRLHLEG